MKKKKGFTLIELLAVIVILGVIMVIAVPKILDLIEDSRQNAAQSSIKLLKDAIKTQVASSQTLSNNTFAVDTEGCYVFNFDNDENNNVEKLTVKNKEHFTGKTTYCNNTFNDDNLAFDGTNTNSQKSVAIGIEYTFDEPKEYTFKAPEMGNYKIELWGAQGGSFSDEVQGGKGAYTSGIINLQKNTTIYIYVGQEGFLGDDSYTFNGGGTGFTARYSSGSGGGATDIRLVKNSWDNFDSLKSRIMVAAGGGGSSWNYKNGGAGGGLIGISGEVDDRISHTPAMGGTQISGGDFGEYGNYYGSHPTSGMFGIGGIGSYGADRYEYCDGGGGGGGAGYTFSGAGGSSYISGLDGCKAISASSTENNITMTNQSVHYSEYKFINGEMIDGNSLMPTHDGTSTMIGNIGNGYARITLISY